MRSLGLNKVVVAIVFFTICCAKDSNVTARKRIRGCRCMKRFIGDVDNLIEEKLRRFEEKYFRPSLRNQRNDSATLARVAGQLDLLDDEVQESRDSLQRMVANMQAIREQVYAQKQDMGTLTGNFQQLDLAVRNLTVFVERLGKLVSTEGIVTPQADTGHVVTTAPDFYPEHCDEVFQEVGRKYLDSYDITVKPEAAPKPFKVLCKSNNNSGWTVIQRRQDGSVDFFRTWDDYKQGFGNLDGEFWLGNDNIHYLTAKGDKMLRIEMEDWSGRIYHAQYDHFKVGNEKHNYKLHVKGYHGNAGDSLTSHWENHDGMAFSTKDRDNDGRYYDSCAQHYHGAWWFNNCFDSHLNGKYYTKGFHSNYFQRDGIQWNSIHQYSSLKRVEMMVKPGSELDNTV